MRTVNVVLIFMAAMSVVPSLFADAQEAPTPRTRSEVEAVLAQAASPTCEDELRSLDIILVAAEKDHDVDEHDYPKWQKRWGAMLGGRRSGIAATQFNIYGVMSKNSTKAQVRN